MRELVHMQGALQYANVQTAMAATMKRECERMHADGQEQGRFFDPITVAPGYVAAVAGGG